MYGRPSELPASFNVIGDISHPKQVSAVLEIDCSRGEGGGQAVRTSVAMAAITGTDTHLTRIRENRPTNGLSKQHCTAVEGVSRLTGCQIIGNQLGSSELTVFPKDEKEYDITMDVGTAGSIALVLQAMMLSLRNHDKPVRIDLTGGTNVMWSPPLDSYKQILFPLMKEIGIECDLEIVQRGLYPEGCGRAVFTSKPYRTIRPLNITDLGKLKCIRGICFAQNLPEWIMDQLIEGCTEILTDVPLEITKESNSEGVSKGAGISLVAEYENGRLGANVLTSRNHPAKQAGIDVAHDLQKIMESGSTMDVHTADQLLPYLAMAEGNSSFSVSRISRHLLSQMDTLETFLDVKFGVERKDNIYHFTVTPGGES